MRPIPAPLGGQSESCRHRLGGALPLRRGLAHRSEARIGRVAARVSNTRAKPQPSGLRASGCTCIDGTGGHPTSLQYGISLLAK